MKKWFVTVLFLCGLIGFMSGPAGANMVEFYFDDLAASGYSDIISVQMNFVPGDLPEDGNFLITKGAAMGGTGAFVETLVTDDWVYAEGLIAYQANPVKVFSDGLIFSLQTMNGVPDVAIDLATIEIFSASDTANPIAGLSITESWVGSNQIVTVSAAVVPIPPAFLLLGSGLFGLVGIRRKK